MANWYYYTKSGEKIGPISSSTLKALTRQGLVTRETIIENQNGRSSAAGQVNGLTFPESAPPDKGNIAPPTTGEIYGVASPKPSTPTRPSAAQPTNMAIEIILNGTTKTVTQQELFNLAAQGIINPQTPVSINGNLGTVGGIKGIAFGQPRTTVASTPFAQSTTPQANAGFTPQQPFQQGTGYSSLPQQPFQQGTGYSPQPQQPFQQGIGYSPLPQQPFQQGTGYSPQPQQPFQQGTGYSPFPVGRVPVTAQGYDYRYIASAHRLSTWSIIIFILVNAIARGLLAASDSLVSEGAELTGGDVFAGLLLLGGIGLALGTAGFSSFCMIRLAKSLQFGVGSIVLLAICLPLPGLCFVPLFVVYFRAASVLKQAGYKVGFIGADMQRFNNRPVTESAKAPYWIIAVSIVVALLLLLLMMLGEAIQAIKAGGMADFARSGTGTDPDITELSPTQVETLRKAAERGDPQAQYDYGDVLFGNKNYTEALQWFRKSANQNNADGQFGVGLCYSQGYGTSKNPTEAVKWFLKSAVQGHALSQLILGGCYENGNGVDQDFVEAMKWYRKAAEQGNETAQYGLGVGCYYGMGVPQNEAEAKKWLQMAAAGGNEEAAEFLKENF